MRVGEDEASLAPCDFLLSGSHTLSLPGLCKHRTYSVEQLKSQLHQRVEKAKEKFREEYVRMLRYPYSDTLQVGDKVLMKAPPCQKGACPIGKVVNTHPGRDGCSCFYDVQVGDVLYKRNYKELAKVPHATD